RSKMLTMWVTEEEHRPLLERSHRKQLAPWLRQRFFEDYDGIAVNLCCLLGSVICIRDWMS
ncbi:hypothetical protein ACVGXV_06440, partial [Enterobacter intestinihominis]